MCIGIIKIDEETENTSHLTRTLLALGVLYAETENTEKACQLWKESMEIVVSTGIDWFVPPIEDLIKQGGEC